MELTLAYLTAKGSQLPVGEESRLVRSTLETGEGDRFAIEFDPDSDQSCIWTVPTIPYTYNGGNLYLTIAYYQDDTNSDSIYFQVEVEATENAEDLSSAQWDTPNNCTTSTANAADELEIQAFNLSNYDTAGQGKHLRIRLSRLGSDMADDNTATVYVVGCRLWEEISLSDGNFITTSSGAIVDSGFSADFSIDACNDVAISSPGDGQVLTWATTEWVNADLPSPPSAPNMLSHAFCWTWENNTEDPPGNGKIYFDDTPPDATEIRIATQNYQGWDMSPYLLNLKGGWLRVYDQSDPNNLGIVWEVGAPTIETGYVVIPITDTILPFLGFSGFSGNEGETIVAFDLAEIDMGYGVTDTLTFDATTGNVDSLTVVNGRITGYTTAS